jgi:hypothetical protein
MPVEYAMHVPSIREKLTRVLSITQPWGEPCSSLIEPDLQRILQGFSSHFRWHKLEDYLTILKKAIVKVLKATQ